MIQAKIEYSRHAPNDEFYTPEIAVDMILPYIPKHITRIWECTAVSERKIVKVLRENGYTVISTHIKDGFDFLKSEPSDYEIIITNPPYSIKDKFLKRAFELRRPFMFLLPISTLEGSWRNKAFRENHIQLIIPDKRFSFLPGKQFGSWFQTSWFTWGLNLDKDLNFISLKDTGSNSSPPKGNSIVELHKDIRKAA